MSALTTPEQIHLFRLKTLRSALRLEMLGMTRRGRSAYAIIKRDMELKGTKQRVLEQLDVIIEARQGELK